MSEFDDMAETVREIAKRDREIERLRAAMQEAANQIRRYDYTPARSTLLVALDVGHNDRVEGRDAASSRRVPSHDGLAGSGSTE